LQKRRRLVDDGAGVIGNNVKRQKATGPDAEPDVFGEKYTFILFHGLSISLYYVLISADAVMRCDC